MTRYFDDFGGHHAVTVLECPEAVVTNVSHNAKNNVQVASFDTRAKLLNKAQRAQFDKIKSPYKKHVTEFCVSEIEKFQVGKVVTVNNFVAGQYIDVKGKTVGKGFAGVMKRHGFAGLEASHGVSISHRSHGSTGQCQDPGRVFKGKKMAGHMGNVSISMQNLEVLKVDGENNLLYVVGSVPGKKGVLLRVADAIKKEIPDTASFPAFFKADQAEVVEEENSEAVEVTQVQQVVDSKEEVKAVPEVVEDTKDVVSEAGESGEDKK